MLFTAFCSNLLGNNSRRVEIMICDPDRRNFVIVSKPAVIGYKIEMTVVSYGKGIVEIRFCIVRHYFILYVLRVGIERERYNALSSYTINDVIGSIPHSEQRRAGHGTIPVRYNSGIYDTCIGENKRIAGLFDSKDHFPCYVGRYKAYLFLIAGNGEQQEEHAACEA